MADRKKLDQQEKQEWQEPTLGKPRSTDEKGVALTSNVKLTPDEGEELVVEGGGLRPEFAKAAHSVFTPPLPQSAEQQEEDEEEEEEEQEEEEQEQEQQEQAANAAAAAAHRREETTKTLETIMDMLLMTALLSRKKSSLESKQDWQQDTHANLLGKGFSLGIPALDRKLHEVLSDSKAMVPKPLIDMLKKTAEFLKEQQDSKHTAKLANPLPELAKMAHNFVNSLKPKSTKEEHENPLLEVFKTIAALGAKDKKGHEPKGPQEGFDLIGKLLTALRNLARGSNQKESRDSLHEVFSATNDNKPGSKGASVIINLLPPEVQSLAQLASGVSVKTPAAATDAFNRLGTILNPQRQQEIEEKKLAIAPRPQPIPTR